MNHRFDFADFPHLSVRTIKLAASPQSPLIEPHACVLQAAQVNFMKMVRGMPMHTTITQAEETLQRETAAETFAEGGKYLPLSVWAQQGFDRSTIERLSLPQDIDEHPVLGVTYRVRIKSLAKTYVREQIRTSKRRAAMPIDRPSAKPAQLAILDGNVDGDGPSDRDHGSDDSSSTSSSSSSSHAKKKKKAKKSKKDSKSKKSKKDKKEKKAKKSKKESAAEKRAREKEERDVAKKEAREDAAAVKLAETLLQKLAAPLAALKSLAEKPNFAVLVPNIKDPLQHALAKLQTLEAECLTVVQESRGSVSYDAKTLAVELTSVRKHTSLATAMLVLMERGAQRS